VENETLEYVSRSSFMSFFIFEYLEKNRSYFDGMTFSQFAENFEIPESLEDEFIVYSRFEEAQIDLSLYKKELETALKANIAQQLYGPNAFEYFLNDGDAMLNKVIELEAAKTAQ
jgi:carboxyl-terminal processing protease